MKGKTKAAIKTLDLMSFEEAIDYLEEHVEILQTPIIIDKNQLFVGFNGSEIRQFIPSINRKLDMRRNNDQGNEDQDYRRRTMLRNFILKRCEEKVKVENKQLRGINNKLLKKVKRLEVENNIIRSKFMNLN